MLPLVLASLLAALPSARLVPDLLRDDPRITFSAKGGHLLPREAASFTVKVQAIEAVEWRVRPVDPTRFEPSLDGYGEGADELENFSFREQFQLVGDALGDSHAKDKATTSVRTRTHRSKVRRPSNALSSWNFTLDLDSLHRLNPGKLLELEVVASPRDFLPSVDTSVCDSARIRDVFLVSRLGLYATSFGSDSLDVLAVDLQSTRPWPGVDLKRVGAMERGIRTGPSGTARLGWTEGSGRWIAIAERREVAVLELDGFANWGQKLEVGLQLPEEEASRLWKNGVRVHPYLLRGVHAPGDTVVAGILVRGPGGAIPSRTVVKARLCREQACLDSIDIPAGKNGHVQWRVALPGNSPTGPWRVEVLSGAEVMAASFRVEDFQPPRMQLDARVLPKRDDSGKCLLEASARWLAGRPASGNAFRASVRRSLQGAGDSSWRVEGFLDGWGKALLPLACDSFGDSRWALRLAVEEAAGRTVSKTFDSLRGPVLAARKSEPPATVIQPVEDGVQEESLQQWGGVRTPTRLPPTRIRIGEVVRTRWEASSSGLALLQVVQGDRILKQRFVQVRRGRQVWSERSDSTWMPRVHLVVSVFGAGFDSARWVRADGRTIELDPPDGSLEVSMRSDSVFAPRSSGRVIVRNRTRRSASVVVSAVDEGILSIDGFHPEAPADWFSEPEKLAIFWWDALGRRDRPHARRFEQNCQLSEGLLGEFGGMGGVGGMGFGASGSSGFGAGLSGARGIRSATARRFAWTSRVLALPPGETAVSFPIGDYTGALRIFAMAVSGMDTRILETSVPVRSPVELKLTAPLAVSPGDTFEVAATVLVGSGRDVSVDVAVEGMSVCCREQSPRDRRDSSGNLERRVRLMAPDSTGEAAIFATASSGRDSARDGDVVRVVDDRSLVALSVSGRTRRTRSLGLTLGARFLPGSANARLELSSGPVVGLDKMWHGLVMYPHGCLEQTLSKAIPQLYLDRLYPQMPPSLRDSARAHAKAAVAKLATFQKPDGLMSLWPREGEPHPWGSLWTLVFLQDYHKRHPNEPRQTLDRLQGALNGVRLPRPFDEAYRLANLEGPDPRDTASIAASLDSLLKLDSGGAMPWMLARAARTKGLASRRWVDTAIARLPSLSGKHRRGMGSSISDRALALEAAAFLGERTASDFLVDSVANDVASPSWQSTRDLGTQLRALAAGDWTRVVDTAARSSVSWDGTNWKVVDLGEGRAVLDVPSSIDTVHVRADGSERIVRALLHRTGRVSKRLAGKPSGLSLGGVHVPDSVLLEGREDSVVFQVRNGTGDLQEDLAATLWMPGGWQVPLDRVAALRKEFREGDVRADRVVLHFRLDKGESRRISIPILARNAGSYRGARIDVEALYDANLFDVWNGPRVQVDSGPR